MENKQVYWEELEAKKLLAFPKRVSLAFREKTKV